MADRVFSDLAKSLIEEFSRSGVRELHIRRGGFELYLSNDASTARQATSPVRSATRAPAAPVSQTSVSVEKPRVQEAGSRGAPASASVKAPNLPEGAIIVTAPNLGTFYRAPKPGAANYVEVGSKVAVGDELCLIEVMKLFTALHAETAGTIHSLLVEDGAMVEAGQPLFAMVAD